MSLHRMSRCIVAVLHTPTHVKDNIEAIQIKLYIKLEQIDT